MGWVSSRATASSCWQQLWPCADILFVPHIEKIKEEDLDEAKYLERMLKEIG